MVKVFWDWDSGWTRFDSEQGEWQDEANCHEVPEALIAAYEQSRKTTAALGKLIADRKGP